MGEDAVQWQAHSRAFVAAVAISISKVSNCVVAVGVVGPRVEDASSRRRLPKDASEPTLVGLWGTRTHTEGTGANL